MGNSSSQVIIEGADQQNTQFITPAAATADNSVLMLDNSSITDDRQLIAQHIEHVSDTIGDYRQSLRIEPENYQVISMTHPKHLRH